MENNIILYNLNIKASKYIGMKKQMIQIIDGIYFQKLSGILSTLQSWQNKKQQTLANLYGESIINVFLKLQKNKRQTTNQTIEFIKLLNLQYSFLSKLRKDQKSSDVLGIFKEFKQFSEYFYEIKQNLLELSQFLGKLIGVTNYQFTVLKKIYNRYEELSLKYESMKQKQPKDFYNKKEQIYSKKSIKKTFEVSKILCIINDLNKQKKFYNQLSHQLYNLYKEQIETKDKMFKDISDNLQFINKLYNKTFQRNIFDSIRQYYLQKMRKIEQEKDYLKYILLDEAIVSKTFEDIQLQFYQDYYKFISQITISHWHIKFYRLKERGSYSSEQQSNLILTFDKKLIFSSEFNKEIILEVNLQELKIYKPNEQSIFEVKNRKNKEKFGIKFNKIQQEDEFFLHYKKDNLA